jgi:uncharacterized protein (TIGR00369 family)
VAFAPQDPDWESRVRTAFAAQTMMQTLGAAIVALEPGRVELRVPFAETLLQQDGFLHAGVALTTLDTACGFAAHSLMPAGARVLTVELKTNLLAPATGTLRVVGTVARAGRTLTVCAGDAYLEADDRHVATTLTTMIQAPG